MNLGADRGTSIFGSYLEELRHSQAPVKELMRDRLGHRLGCTCFRVASIWKLSNGPLQIC